MCKYARLVRPTIGQVEPLTQNRKVDVHACARAFSWEREFVRNDFLSRTVRSAWKGKPPLLSPLPAETRYIDLPQANFDVRAQKRSFPGRIPNPW